MTLNLLPFLLIPVLAQTATPSATPTATPTPLPLTISNLPSQITKGDEFTLTVNLHAKSSTVYYFKIYGGVGENYSIEVKNNDNWINGYNGSWDAMPSATTDSNGNNSQDLILRFKTDKTSGTSQLVAKVKDSTTNNYLLSSTYNLDVVDPASPTSTPTPTQTPPTATPTTKPTTIPTATPTSLPSVSPSNQPTNQLIENIVDTPTNQVLGVSQTNTPTPTASIALVSIGSILLLVPLVIAKL